MTTFADSGLAPSFIDGSAIGAENYVAGWAQQDSYRRFTGSHGLGDLAVGAESLLPGSTIHRVVHFDNPDEYGNDTNLRIAVTDQGSAEPIVATSRVRERSGGFVYFHQFDPGRFAVATTTGDITEPSTGWTVRRAFASFTSIQRTAQVLPGLSQPSVSSEVGQEHLALEVTHPGLENYLVRLELNRVSGTGTFNLPQIGVGKDLFSRAQTGWVLRASETAGHSQRWAEMDHSEQPSGRNPVAADYWLKRIMHFASAKDRGSVADPSLATMGT